MRFATDLKIKLFADGADKAAMLEMYRNPSIQGFTTNPTLMRKAGIADYTSFAREIVQAIPDRPISFEVFADDFNEMERQARIIAGWGPNVNAKIPITNTKGEPCFDLVRKLTREGIKLNITALLTLDQVRCVASSLQGGAPAFVSVFAGRIADTGIDPVPIMSASLQEIAGLPGVELIWASPRELLKRCPGGCDRLPYHHRYERHLEKAFDPGQRLGAIFFRNRPNVSRRRAQLRIYALAQDPVARR